MAAFKKESWTGADVRCPFYVSHDRAARSISCEGYSEGAEVISRFRSIQQKERHMGTYCVGRFERCPVYKCTYGEKYANV